LAPLSSWVLQNGERALRGLGPHPERARRDAETLLLHLLGKDKAWLMRIIDEEFWPNTAALHCAY
jgi:hypothetical protein